MRPTDLLLVVATPVLCATQARTVAQVPVLVGSHEVATSVYPQHLAVNGTIGMALLESDTKSVANSLVPASIVKSTAVDTVDSSNMPSTAAAAAADIPAPALDKSIFSLIVFGVAGLCLL